MLRDIQAVVSYGICVVSNEPRRKNVEMMERHSEEAIKRRGPQDRRLQPRDDAAYLLVGIVVELLRHDSTVTSVAQICVEMVNP